MNTAYTNYCKLPLYLLLSFSFFISSAFAIETSAANSQQKTNLYPISSPISSGVIKKIYVKEGQNTKQGDLLFEFDDRLIKSNLEEARANVKLARLKVIEAKKDVARSEELYERTVLSDYDLQQSKIQYSEAQASLAQASNKLVHAQWDQDFSKVYAPFTGIVKKVFCYSGCYVNNNFSTQTIIMLEKAQ